MRRCIPLQFVDEQHRPFYRTINWGAFRAKRYEGAVVTLGGGLLLWLKAMRSLPGSRINICCVSWVQGTMQTVARRCRSPNTAWTGSRRGSSSRSLPPVPQKHSQQQHAASVRRQMRVGHACLQQPRHLALLSLLGFVVYIK